MNKILQIGGSRSIHIIIHNMKLANLFGMLVLSAVMLAIKAETVCNGIWCTPEVDTTECKGSIKFFKNGVVDQIISADETSNLPSSILYDSLRVEGCLCWIIYKTKNLRGRQEKLWQGNTYDKDEIGFGRLKKLKAVKCESIASGTWIVVVIVAVIALVAVMATVVGVKCYNKRKYTQTALEP